MARRTAKLNPQPWPWPGPRVLIERQDDEETLALASALRRAGYAVAICPGPHAPDRCPLAGADGCATAHGADVVVSCLGLKRPESRAVLAAYRTTMPSLPLVV